MEIQTKRWKRWLRNFLLSILAFLIVCFLLFSFFLVNPLERKYPADLSYLLPLASDAAFYIPSPETMVRKMTKLISWGDWARQKDTQEFLQSPLYQNFLKRIHYKEITKQREQIQKKYGVDLVQFLQEIAGKEMAAALRFSQKERDLHWVVVSRISFKMKVAYALTPYLPASLQKRLSMQYENGMLSLSPSSPAPLYLMRQRDLLFLSNSAPFLREASEDRKDPTLLAKKLFLQELWSAKASEVFFYLDGASCAKHMQAQGFKVQPDFQERLAGIQSLWGEFNLTKEKINLTFRMAGREDNKDYFVPCAADEAGNLPSETFLYTTAFVPWKNLLPHWQSYLPKEWQKEALFYEKILIRHYGEDFLARHIGDFLENETLVVFSRLDFVKENLSPLDPYPGFALMIRSQDAHRLLATLETFTKKILDETLKKQWKDEGVEFLLREKYAEQEYLRIKFPDVSGGAIRPSAGVLGNYLVLTSHAAFYKNLLDVKDKLESGLDKNPAYKNFAWKGPWRLFLDGEKLLKIVGELRPQILDWITYALAQNHRKRKINKVTIAQQWDEGIRIFRLFQTSLGVDCSMENNLIEGKVTLALEMRK